ncbi:uroplakin-3b-like [Megalops cyprinoides]|uniref:uroplakin-3b-like n=1 Tax=Megalops cyprinoides TaxID=118141 RepID=UPI001864DE4F|nr:uroplakin-3b-like [Megalops cyprinoides]
MAVLTIACVAVCLSFCSVAVQSTTVSQIPVITPYDYIGKITTNTIILKPPQCYFNTSLLNCTSETCQIYVVPAVGSGPKNFDQDKRSQNSSILSLSPYPTAFASNTSKNYYLTKVGPPESYTCTQTSGMTYFLVGSDGNCSDPNCNGILPTGSKVRFKYILVNKPNDKIRQETNWSTPITLYSPKNLSTINDGFSGRSAAMVVITTILCVALGLLLLLLLVGLIYAHCCRQRSEPMPILGSLKIRKYDTHHLKDPVPYVNPTYDGDLKKFSTPEVLPKVPHGGNAPELPDSVKLKRYNNYDFTQSEGQNS